jgi:hypothetical protein
MTHSSTSFRILAWFLLALAFIGPARAIKFQLPASRFPSAKCVWNAAHDNALVIVTANVSPGENMRVDVEIVDSSAKKNVYLHKRGIVGETRLAVTTHAEGEVGVCFKNYLSSGSSLREIVRSELYPDILTQTQQSLTTRSSSALWILT